MIPISENVDRLSSLPEDVIAHILSLMPTTLAVRTCILSKRWRYSWTLIHSLNFEDFHHGDNSFLKFVDHVLELCETSKIRIFRLCAFSVPIPILVRWVSVAIRLHVRILDIKVRVTYFSPSVFTCKTLTKLRIDVKNISESLSSVNLPNLKSLYIRVFSRVSFDHVFKVIHGCPILEILYLGIKHRLDNEDYYFNIPTLKQFKLQIVHSETKIHRIVLNFPNLEYLSIKGILASHFVMEDLSSLVMVKVSPTRRGYDNPTWAEFLKGISGAKSISASFQASTTWPDPLSFPLPKFPNLKQLELKGCTDDKWRLILHVLQNSPELEHLCMQKLIQTRHGCYLNEPGIVLTSMFMNLKTMEYRKSVRDEFDIHFFRFLLANSKVLKKLTVFIDINIDINIPFKEKQMFIATLSMLPRAPGSDCEICFVDGYGPNRFQIC